MRENPDQNNSEYGHFLRSLNQRRICGNLILRASSANNSKIVCLRLKTQNFFMQKFTYTENILPDTEQKTLEKSKVKDEKVLATINSKSSR